MSQRTVEIVFWFAMALIGVGIVLMLLMACGVFGQ